MTKDEPRPRGFLAVRKLELALYRAPRPRSDLRPYVIFGHYRSGTTVLTQMLDSHPDVYCGGEVLLDYLGFRPRWLILPQVFCTRRAAEADTLIGGITLRTDQLDACLLPMLRGGPSGFIRRLAAGGWNVIHLIRENALKQALSNIEAHAREEWHFKTGERLPTQALHVDPPRLVRSIRWGQRRRHAEDAALSGVSHCSVVYERDLLDGSRHQETMDRVFGYLGADPHPVQASLRKIGRRPLNERIENYDEVLVALQRANLDHYLREDDSDAPRPSTE